MQVLRSREHSFEEGRCDGVMRMPGLAVHLPCDTEKRLTGRLTCLVR